MSWFGRFWHTARRSEDRLKEDLNLALCRSVPFSDEAADKQVELERAREAHKEVVEPSCSTEATTGRPAP